MSLVSTLKAIRKEIKRKIEQDLDSDIKKVLVGKKLKIQGMQFPFIWVMPMSNTIDSQGLSLHEQWDLKYWIIAIVRSTSDPEDARDLSEALALRASGALITNNEGKENRSLNGLVSYITRIGFSPSDDRILDSDESLYGAGVQMQIRLENEEVE